MRIFDFLYLFFILAVIGFLCYSVYRLYRTRVIYNLVLVAVQLTAVTVAALSIGGGVQRDAFIVTFVVVVGVFTPLGFLAFDYIKLRQALKERTQMTISRLIYKNYTKPGQTERIDIWRPEAYVRPIAGDSPIEDIIEEIRVERSDTTRNVLKQLESAYKSKIEGDLEGAYEVYSLIEKIFNRAPSLYYNMGNLKFLSGNFEEAAKNYRRGADCAGNKEFEGTLESEKVGLIYYNLGNTYFMQRKYIKAIEAYKAAAEKYPAKDEIYFNMSFCHAMDFQETGDIDKAVPAFLKIIEDMPENHFAWYNFGTCLYQLGNISHAIECFLRVVNEDYTYYKCWFSLAMAYDEAGFATDAIQAYYTAIEVKPDFIDAYNNLGVVLSSVGRYGEALKVLRTGAKIKPDDHELRFNIGLTLYELKKYDEALEALLPAVKNRQDDDALLYAISLVFLYMEREQEAVEYLSYAVMNNPMIKDRAARDEKFKRLLYSNEAYSYLRD